MKKLRIQFIIFFVTLSAVLAFILWHSYRQMDQEEFRLWQGEAEKTFNQMQAAISEYLEKEDGRSFSEYRYYFIPETQVSAGYALNVSPLSEPPENDARGLVGYFQIGPDGSFHTPYLPDAPIVLADQNERKFLQSRLKDITLSLQGAVKTSHAQDKELTNRGARKAVDVSVLPHKTAAPESYLYPNPLRKKNAGSSASVAMAKRAEEQKDQEAMIRESSGSERDYQQQMKSNVAQVKTFEKQDAARPSLPEPPSGVVGTLVVMGDEKASVLTDPFRARLVDGQYLVFYRRLWLREQLYVQGFVLDLKPFFEWLAGNSFMNTDLPGFATASLVLENTALATTGFPGTALSEKTDLFRRGLGYPLNQFVYEVTYLALPNLSARGLLHVLTFFIVFLVTGGLLVIYRSAAAQVLLSQKRQDFVSAVTHELKTPLTSIRLYSEMLTEGWTKDAAKQKEYFGLISSESSRLARLIENVLQLSRLEKKNYRYQLTTKNPREDFLIMAGELTTLAQKHGFVFETVLDDSLPMISYDADVLKQIMYTLTDNSIKFSQNALQKHITMTLVVKGQSLIWSLADKGPGVPHNELGKVFAKFYRVENELTRQTKGTGIGLAMAKMLVHGMGAKIFAENQSSGGLKVSVAMMCG
ncbi:MAG: ATPase protein [uncultured bacterium]|nr:MAG: ATPase protein [uncultured bacterium]